MTPLATHPCRLRTAITRLPQHAALLDGSITVPGVEFDFVDVAEHSEIFRRMGQAEEFDVCEWSAVSYLLARDVGMPVRALPIVPRHVFPHHDFVVNRHAGITGPADLVGRHVATRSYTVTPGVLDRGLLADDFGIDAADVTWVLAEPEHVPAYQSRLPTNVVPPDGRGNLFPLLVSGELTAGIAGSNLLRERSDDVVPLFPDPAELDRKRYETTRIVPVFTVITVHERVLSEREWLLEALYAAFATAALQDYEWGARIAGIVGDAAPPVGLSANRAGFDQLLRYAHEQHVLRGPAAVDELFEPFD